MGIMQATETGVIEATQLDALLSAIRAFGFAVIGPQVREGALHLSEIETTGDLPRGWVDHQEAGTYRLESGQGNSLFDFAVGAESWKQFLFPPRLSLYRATLQDGGVTLDEPTPPARKLAFFGVRSCDLAAIAVQDRVFMEGPYVDPAYAAQRASLCIVAVNCRRAASTCFCASMNTGPRCTHGFDLALTELGDRPNCQFLIESGSELGQGILHRVDYRPATADDLAKAETATAAAVAQMKRNVDPVKARQALAGSWDSPRWQAIAERCLSCGNCTMVCPTCFCSSVEDTTDLSGAISERTRRWESCFTATHSYMHGGPVRGGGASRYRQWMTHKFGSWWDQFETCGCIGCGRCITWCPVGIDISAELQAMQLEENNRVNADASTST